MSKYLNTTDRRPLVIWLVICLVVFWIAASLITVRGMEPFEHSIFNAVYDLPLALKPTFVVITQAGSLIMILVICGLLVRKKYRLQAARLLLLSGITYLVVLLTKHYFQRPRPNILLTDVLQRGPHEGDYGFPSAHAALAMAVAIALLPLVPKRWWWLVFTAVGLVGISRIYLGVHAPLDIVGGFSIGAAISLTYLLIMSSGSNKKSVKNKTI